MFQQELGWFRSNSTLSQVPAIGCCGYVAVNDLLSCLAECHQMSGCGSFHPWSSVYRLAKDPAKTGLKPLYRSLYRYKPTRVTFRPVTLGVTKRPRTNACKDGSYLNVLRFNVAVPRQIEAPTKTPSNTLILKII